MTKLNVLLSNTTIDADVANTLLGKTNIVTLAGTATSVNILDDASIGCPACTGIFS
jgi:hypothetical protein